MSRPPGAFAEAGQLARALIACAPGKAALALLLLLAAGVTEAFGIVLIIPLLDLIGLSGSQGEQGPIAAAAARAAAAFGIELTLPMVLGVFLALAAVRSASAWRRNILLAEMRLGFVDRLREQLYTAIAAAKWEFLRDRRLSDALHVLTSDVNRIGQGALVLPQLAVTAVLALVQIVIAVLLSPLVSLAAILTGATLLLLTRPLMRRSRTLGEQITNASRAMFQSSTDFLAGLKLAKSYNAEALHVRHFTDATAAMRRRQLAFAEASAVVRETLAIGGAAAPAALVWFAVSAAALTPPELLVMVLIFMRVMPALSRLQRHAQQLAHALPAYAHMQGIHRSLREAAETPAGSTEAPIDLRRAVTLRNVSFVYGRAADKPALAGIDLDVPAGSMTAIAGASGAGKSTLVDILLGLIEPGGGEVRVDDVPLSGSNLRRWRRSVAYVPQEPYLFHESIRANLDWARPGASEDEMWRALRRAAAGDFVAALPEGLDTVAGDRGDRFSGGERQRIALARALLREPVLLLLDEATSQLDADTEQQVLAALESLRGRTTIVAVAHRPAVIQAADRIVLLESGRVASAGTWRELARRLSAVTHGMQEGAANRSGA